MAQDLVHKIISQKFKDIDLIGIPHRFVVSKRMLDSGGVEYKKRGDAATSTWKPEEAAGKLSESLSGGTLAAR